MKELIKKFAFKYTRFGAPHYSYNVEPLQLAQIILSIEALSEQKDKLNIFEIGVARGMTSRFIAEHIVKTDSVVNFYCIDTFASFTKSDLAHEISNRGKSRGELKGFAYNDFDIWRRNFRGFSFVKPVQIDAGAFDFSSIEGGIDFIFLDVDLYQPTIKVLRNSMSFLNDGAIILVDDVKDNNSWDGAYQAFFEFVREYKLEHQIIGNKCGKIIWKKIV